MTQPTLDEDELLDLVDNDNVVIAQMLRSEVYAKNLHNFRAVELFIRNAKGELWIPRRGAHKRRCPNGLDRSMSGHVQSGETYEEALFREAREELNIDAGDARLLGLLTPKDGVFDFMQVYELAMDAAPNYNPDDFSGYEWLPPAEIVRRVEAGEPAKDDLALIVRRFYLTA